MFRTILRTKYIKNKFGQYLFKLHCNMSRIRKEIVCKFTEQNESFTVTETSKDVELINKNIEEQQLDNSEKNSLTTLQQTTK